jgi:hypothetical protein
MWEASACTQTSAPTSAVWELWEDPARWVEWNDEIVSGELEGPFAVGSIARIKLRAFPRLGFEFIEIDPGRLLVSQTRLPGVRLRHYHLVEGEGEGDLTKITNRMCLVGPAAPIYGLFLGWRLRRSVRGFARREQELAEAAS